MSDDSFVELVLDHLDAMGDVDSRAMFGGHGIYVDDLYFAIVHEGRLYFPTDETTRPDYETEGMGRFYPYGDDRAMGSYYEVPPDVIEDPDELVAWARKAIETKG